MTEESFPGRPDFSPIAKIALTWFFMTLIFILNSLRLYVQRNRKRYPARLTADVLSWLSWSIALIASVLITWEYVMLERWDTTIPRDPRRHPYLQVENKKMHFFFTFSYFCAAWGIKGAFIAMYFDVFPTHQIQKKYLRYTMYAVAVYTGVTFLVNVIASITYCHPIESNWVPGPNNCAPFRSRHMLLVSYITNVTSDVFILILPMSFIQRLRLRQSHYWGIAFLLALVFFTIAAATMRFVFLWRAFQGNPREQKDFDTSIREVHSIMTWSQIETWLTMVIFALPPLRVYLRGRKAHDFAATGTARVAKNGSKVSTCNDGLSSVRQSRFKTKWDDDDDSSETELRRINTQERIEDVEERDTSMPTT